MVDKTTEYCARILAEIRPLQLKYDSRALSAVLLGAAARLYQVQIAAGLIKPEAVEALYATSLESAKAPSKDQPKVMFVGTDTVDKPQRAN